MDSQVYPRGKVMIILFFSFFDKRKCLYLPWAFSWWTVLSVDNAGHTRHLRGDHLLENFLFCQNLAVAPVVRKWWLCFRPIHLLGGVDVGVAVRSVQPSSVLLRRVLSLVPKNSPDVFGDDGATFEGLCKSSCEV